MAGESKSTTDHDKIRSWAQARGGVPSKIKGTGDGDDAGLIRIHFPDFSSDEPFEEISWDDFFRKFDESNLEFVYQEDTSGGRRSNFFKLVRRNGGQ